MVLDQDIPVKLNESISLKTSSMLWTSKNKLTYGTAQRQLDACTWVAGSAPEGDISMGKQVPAGIFSVSSKACL